jgi:hypothetical protein
VRVAISGVGKALLVGTPVPVLATTFVWELLPPATAVVGAADARLVDWGGVLSLSKRISSV